jgi:diadenosine tetraphosphate (Ap4A) HIT family hydrolase
MMVDPNVHFHVIPRFSDSRRWEGVEFPDNGWPGPPLLKLVVNLNGTQMKALRNQLKPYF